MLLFIIIIYYIYYIYIFIHFDIWYSFWDLLKQLHYNSVIQLLVFLKLNFKQALDDKGNRNVKACTMNINN